MIPCFSKTWNNPQGFFFFLSVMWLLVTPGRRWRLWRFASLIPSGCRLPPIHKVMGDHASRAATPVRASPRVDCCMSMISCFNGGMRPRLVSGGVDFQRVIKQGVETWPKKACVSTLRLKLYLIIS